MKIAATILALVPGLLSFMSDPDALGVGILVLFLIPLYVAWRTKIAGGYFLILVGLLMLVILIINEIKPPGVPADLPSILTWIVLIAFPILSGILFIRAGRKELRK